MSVKRSTAISVGGSSILVVFILLCLTTFATLSLASANADKKLTDKAALAITQYYEADSRAEELLSVVDGCLFQAMTGAADKSAYLSGVESLISGIDTPVTLDGDFIRYTVPVNENQSLEVALKVLYPADTGELFERLEWKVVNTGEWTPEDESFLLWGGDDTGGLPFLQG